jgi:acyl-CoA synthetase (AMP-forming)/AMP-acid ligase II
MGLIGSYLGAIYCGCIGYYMSPITFLKDPTMWLRAMSRYKGTHTQAPNFAFALATRKFKEACRDGDTGTLDLSSIRHMLNAAEPVDSVAIAEFYGYFREHGLQVMNEAVLRRACILRLSALSHHVMISANLSSKYELINHLIMSVNHVG